jgi:hypothetical protein
MRVDAVPYLSRYALFVVVACIGIGAGPAFAALDAGCKERAIDRLKALAPSGFLVYQQIKDKQFFKRWITCGDSQLGLPTAVHESVHHLTQDHDAFPLMDLSYIKRPHEVSKFFAPSVIANKFQRSDLVSTYLRPGTSSSSTDFLYLLDELNAYTHDLDASAALDGLRLHNEEVDSRDGLAALMAFVAIYVETAEESYPETWRGLQEPAVAKAVSTLWSQAEKVMVSSCGIANFGHNDQSFIRQFCETKPQASLAKILNRPPVCPVECLSTAPKSATQR